MFSDQLQTTIRRKLTIRLSFGVASLLGLSGGSFPTFRIDSYDSDIADNNCSNLFSN